MIDIVIQDFDIEKAEQLLKEYSDNRDLLKTVFVRELINYQRNFPRSILYQEILVRRRYTRELIVSVLKEFGYELLEYNSPSKFKLNTDILQPKYSLIVFGPPA